MLYSCSGDKTISFWDSRTGICSQTLFGHLNTINHALFTMNGKSFASCDADGVVKLWDLRMTCEIESFETGSAANKLTFDPSGTILGVAGNNGIIKFIYATDKNRSREIKTNDDSVQSILLDKSGEFLVSSGNGNSILIRWHIPNISINLSLIQSIFHTFVAPSAPHGAANSS